MKYNSLEKTTYMVTIQTTTLQVIVPNVSGQENNTKINLIISY